jgi:hypothetical protein
MKETQEGWIASSMNKNDTIIIIKKREETRAILYLTEMGAVLVRFREMHQICSKC